MRKEAREEGELLISPYSLPVISLNWQNSLLLLHHQVERRNSLIYRLNIKIYLFEVVSSFYRPPHSTLGRSSDSKRSRARSEHPEGTFHSRKKEFNRRRGILLHRAGGSSFLFSRTRAHHLGWYWRWNILSKCHNLQTLVLHRDIYSFSLAEKSRPLTFLTHSLKRIFLNSYRLAFKHDCSKHDLDLGVLFRSASGFSAFQHQLALLQLRFRVLRDVQRSIKSHAARFKVPDGLAR